MASKPENTFRCGVHKYLPLQLHHEKMCNPYSSGTPDDWYSGLKSDLWVEYKFLPKIPQRVNIKPDKLLSDLQARWLRGRYVEGRAVAVIIGCPEGGAILPGLDWEQEISPASFRDNLVSRKEVALWLQKETMG